jgi:hypothetical protein
MLVNMNEMIIHGVGKIFLDVMFVRDWSLTEAWFEPSQYKIGRIDTIRKEG